MTTTTATDPTPTPPPPPPPPAAPPAAPRPLLPVRLLFLLAAAYDGALAAAFLLRGPQLFERFGVEPPNHWGYVQFPALLLLLFTVLFLQVAAAPRRSRMLIPYGVGLKLCYAGVVLWHWIGGSIPALWKPFAVADLLFVAAFAWAWWRLR